MSDLYLSHYGVKGMKWGVRRYQNYDGTWTDRGKKRRFHDRNEKRNLKYIDDINSIVDSLSEQDRAFLGAEDDYKWVEKGNEKNYARKAAVMFVQKEGDIPVSFIEVTVGENERTGQIALATRNEEQYRGKGYADKNVKKAIDYVDRYLNKSIDELEWIADRNNIGSVHLSNKYGFVEDDPTNHGHPQSWKDYTDDFSIAYRPVKKNR